MRQGLHCHAMVRFELDDLKILFVALADLMVCGSYAYRALGELPYLKNVVVPLRNVLEVGDELENRFDFKGSHIVMELDKKESKIKLETDSDMKMAQVTDVLSPFGSSRNSPMLWASKGFRKSSLITIFCGADASRISIRPEPTFLSPSQA